ncbi:MAG TPA: DUF4870 domain-containing protein [Pyrinomonadaceae bacterium]
MSGSGDKSALGLDGNVTALIGYIVGIVALIEIFIEKDNKWVRFHAIQSVLYHVAAFVVIFALMIVGGIVAAILSQISAVLSLVGILIYILGLLLWLGWLVGMIYGALKAYQGVTFKYPIVGNMAEKWSN